MSGVEDSLTRLIFNTYDAHDKVLLMGQLSWELKFNDSQKSLEIARQAYELALSDSPSDIIYTKNLIGNSFLGLEQEDSAMFYFFEVYQLANDQGDTSFMAKALNNQAIVYMELDKYEKSLEKMSQCARLEFLSNDLKGATVSFNNLGTLYLQLGNLVDAKTNLMKALSLAERTGNHKNLANVYLNLGALEVKSGHYDIGKSWFFSAIEKQKEANDLDGVARSYFNLALAFREQGKNKIALVFDLKSLEFAELLDSPSAKKAAYFDLAKTYESMGNFELALENYKLSMALKDTILELENARLLIEMQEKYKSEQTIKENKILLQENKIESLQNRENEAKLGKSRILVFAVIISLVLVIGLTIVLFNRNRIKQKANLELQEASNIIQEKNNDITASIEYARKIQEALLPTKEMNGLFNDSFLILEPKDIVSGDFFWYSKVDNKIVFTAADCTGHGVPGAFMSMIGNTFLHQIVNERRELNPGKILDELKISVVESLSSQGEDGARKDGMDMAICVLDLSSNTMEYAGANNPLYVIQNGNFIEFKPDKQPVGYMPERDQNFITHTVQLDVGDAVYIFSDGFVDQFGGPKGKKFKYNQLRDILTENYSRSMKDQKEILLNAFYTWKGDLEQIDDVCLIGVRV